MATFNSKLQQITEEITAVRGKLQVPRANWNGRDDQDTADYETQKLVKQLAELVSQQRALFQGYNQVVQKEEEYAAGLERERQQGYAEVAQLEKIVANLRAKLPQAGASSSPDVLTMDASAANQASVSNSTGHVGHEEQSSGMSDNANVPPAETPRRHGRRGSSIVVDTSSIRAHEERPKDLASERRERKERKRKHRVSLAASGDKVAKRRNTANARLLDVDRPFTATLASNWTEDPWISDNGTVDFRNLYHNGEVVSYCMVLEHPPESDRFYIFYCQVHDQFMKNIPLNGARRHLRRHEMYESEPDEVMVEMFGVRVLNCTQDLAKEYNDAIYPHFKAKTWRSRQKKKAAARGTNQPNGDDDAVNNTYSTPTRAPLRSLIPPARRSSRQCVSSHTLATRHWETLITNPKVGEIYCLTWHRDDRNYAVIVLPIGSFEPVGIPGSILATNLLEEGRRKSHATDPSTGDYIWSPGYEDGGKLEDEREFPVIYFDNSLFPQNASYGWAMAADLQVFDSEDASIPYLKTVTEFLKDRKDRGQAHGSEDDATRADSQTETPVDSTPSVPAVRDENHPIPQIDAYFNAATRSESGSDLDDDGYSTDEWSLDPSDDEKDASTEPNMASCQDGHKPPVARMGTGTCEEDSWDLPSDTIVDGRANEPSQTRSSTQQAGLARLALAHGEGAAEKQTPSLSSKSQAPSDTSAAAAAAAESRPSCANTTTAIFTAKQPEALALLAGGQDVGRKPEGSSSSSTHLRHSFGRIRETWPGLVLRPEVRTPSSPTYTAQQRITIDHLMHTAGMPKAPLHTR
ncbi:hypothetical protein H634G_10724 [Metarhizium anisopliae BRIP 53293]|uniref:Uncharacterized protein n=1 Tax=Metarhizium anisopliae BRIP 53293 TaxID=1291518 RepID=A0A0D9NJS2_METAN|nr:hypothetical protein H634G_10724 [Metarhizium anisopliae BRIP 53293]KJK92250.1 hypothetical protein H633G_03865 [Metarhizium anisopliae BRIP 53284]